MRITRLSNISRLFKEYQLKKRGKETLLTMIDENELAERVYNSNAIENSTLTLPETEKILLQIELSRRISLREIFETKNLALVYSYVKKTAVEKSIDIDVILLLHKMLLTNIRDEVAGRFRMGDEMVRIDNHIAVPPQFIIQRMQEAIVQFDSDITTPYIHKVARFHCEFENIHPFIDGNGRIGRVLNNYFLYRAGFPSIIVRNKEKRTYYDGLRSYDTFGDLKPMIRTFELAVLESLHKRLAFLDNMRIISLAEYALTGTQSLHTLINAARRQTIPVFREKGAWKIGVKYRRKKF